MHFKIGDYVEGYRMAKYELWLQYTRGWIVDIGYTNDKLDYLAINEDMPHMLDKYWSDKDNQEQEYNIKHKFYEDSMYLVVGDPRYQVRKVKRQEKWWSRYFKDADRIDEKADKTKMMPYYIDRSMFKILGVAKVFTLDGVLQVPNSMYTDKINEVYYENQPIEKMIRYIERYSLRNRRILLVDVDYGVDIDEALKGKVNPRILELFDKERIAKAPSFEAKACKVDEIANSMPNGEDLLLIDNDIRIIEEIQNNRLFPKQARNLKAIHISAFLDMKI